MANRLYKTAETGYLLGGLSEQERASLEDEFFTDEEKFQELELAEDDLIDAYVRDELTPAEQHQFRERLLIIPRIIERVDFARALAERSSLLIPAVPAEVAQPERSSSTHPQPKPRWWESLFGARQSRLAFAASLMLVVIGGGTLLAGWLRLREESARQVAERAAIQRRQADLDKQSTEQQAAAEKLTAELQQLADERKALDERQRREAPGPSVLGLTVPFLLAPVGSRGPGAGSDLKFASDVQTAELKLLLPKAEYRSYNVTVRSDGRLVTTKKGIKPRKSGPDSIVAFSVPVRLLPPGDYTVRLAGLTSTGQGEEVDDYQFRVLKAK